MEAVRGGAASLWGDQGELRWSMERLADEALDRAGVELDPRGFLIGFPVDGSDAVLIEPERNAFDVEPLAGLLARADALFAERRRTTCPAFCPEARSVQAGAPHPADEEWHPEHYLTALLEGCRRQVLLEALDTAARFDDRRLFVGMSVVVDDHRVFPVLAVLSEPWAELPKLSTTTIDGFDAAACFPEAVIDDVLRAASHELDRKHPVSLIGIDAGAVLRSAADTFVNGCASRAGQEFALGLRDALDAVSAQTYEGRPSLGTLVLAQPTHDAVRCEVAFEHEVPVSVPRSFRKALEMTGPGFELLCDGRKVYGLGTLEEAYDTADERCFTVRVVGNGSWELWHATTPFLRVDNGQPTLPRDLVDADTFVHTVRRVFPEATDQHANILWDMAQACIRQQHGTMLVVHPDARAEGERLLPQAYTVEPTRLGPNAFHALTKIDGAVLVSPEGHCHAVGVILDGAATGTGDISRGARYNSAIRYLAGRGKGSMVIIVSEDGRIDILPQLARRMRRSTVERVVQQLVTAAHEGHDYEKVARLDARATQLEFYLDAEQCEAVNDARETVEQRRWAEERVRMQVVPIAPHPAMDDSYFVTPEQ
ncbi:hypothetical protein ACWKWA_05900 [Dermacoccus abyssi]